MNINVPKLHEYTLESRIQLSIKKKKIILMVLVTLICSRFALLGLPTLIDGVFTSSKLVSSRVDKIY